MGLVSLSTEKEGPELNLSLLSEDTTRRLASTGGGTSPGAKQAGTLILAFPASRTLRNTCPLFKPSSLGYFVIAAQADYDSKYLRLCVKATLENYF